MRDGSLIGFGHRAGVGKDSAAFCCVDHMARFVDEARRKLARDNPRIGTRSVAEIVRIPLHSPLHPIAHPLPPFHQVAQVDMLAHSYVMASVLEGFFGKSLLGYGG